MRIGKLLSFALGPMGAAGVSLISVPLIAWFFSAEDVGRVAMLQLAISFCLLVFSLGLDQAYVREYHEHSNKLALLNSCIFPGLSLLTLFVLFDNFYYRGLSNFLFGDDDFYVNIIITVCLVSNFIIRFLSLILRMQERGIAFSMSQILPKISFLAFVFICIFIFNKSSFSSLLASNALSFLLTSFVLIAVLLRKPVGYLNFYLLSRVETVRLIKYGMPLAVGSLFFWGMISMDRIFLRKFADFEDLGIYSVCISFAGVGSILQSIFSTIWAPSVYKKYASGDCSENIQASNQHVLAAIVFTFSFIGTFSWILDYILPAEYSACKNILLACLTYPLLYTLGEASGIGLGIMRKSNIVMVITFLSLIINIVLNFVLVPSYGASGAASATAISFMCLMIFRTETAAKYWIEFPRKNIYIWSFLCTGIAVAQSILGVYYWYVFNFIWLSVFLSAIFYFKSSILSFVKFIGEFLNKSN